MDVDYDQIGLTVGLEIHQQLATNRKLFCSCSQIEAEEYTKKFSRRLRISKSEMGEYDPAAVFEKTKSKKIIYYANPQSSCLVEEDEEPPHELDKEAKRITLIIASALKAKIFKEIFPMRKIVIDGSNTTGFQRTMLVSQGGRLATSYGDIGVQSICLEEDAAKLIGDEGGTRKYGLDRLGIPLVEIALEPVKTDPQKIKDIALELGRLLRTTRMVARGIGSIRQDVNVSIKDGGGIVEVKGVQQLDQLQKVVEFEAKRQDALLKIAKKIPKEIRITDEDVFDVTELFRECQSKIIQKSLKNNFVIKAIRIRNFAGIFGYEPHKGVRLGRELGQIAKSFGIGGVFHSDELPSYGITQKEVEAIMQELQTTKEDAFLIIAVEPEKSKPILNSIIERITKAKDGVPSETRLATASGETVFLRPRPGASRMYPETDVPPIIVTEWELKEAEEKIPHPWHQAIEELKERYKLNTQLAEQIFDSPFLELFENISQQGVSPNFVASTLCSTITNLTRKGLDPKLLKQEHILDVFKFLAEGKISKESIEIIFEDIMSGNSKAVKEAVDRLSIGIMPKEELERVLADIATKNRDLIIKQRERAIGPLMGIAMKDLRGKASGETINSLLRGMISKIIQTSDEK